MKKIFLMFTIICMGITLLMAQTRSPRLVLAEEFSGAW